SFGQRVAKILFRTRKSGWPIWALSMASGKLRARWRKSSTVMVVPTLLPASRIPPDEHAQQIRIIICPNPLSWSPDVVLPARVLQQGSEVLGPTRHDHPFGATFALSALLRCNIQI